MRCTMPDDVSRITFVTNFSSTVQLNLPLLVTVYLQKSFTIKKLSSFKEISITHLLKFNTYTGTIAV